MLKIAITENERDAAYTLKSFVKKWSAENKTEVKTVLFEDGMELVENYRPDFDAVFMDIMMPHLDGMSAAERLRLVDADVPIVFVTNMAQFALRGYKVQALDYLVKPITYFDFAVEMKKIVKIAASRDDKVLYVTADGVVRKLPQSKIEYVEIMNHNVMIHIGEDTLSFRGTLKEIESKLDAERFARCNNCFIVNMKYVAEIDGDVLRTERGDTLPISRPRKSGFMSQLNAYVAGMSRGGGGLFKCLRSTSIPWCSSSGFSTSFWKCMPRSSCACISRKSVNSFRFAQ